MRVRQRSPVVRRGFAPSNHPPSRRQITTCACPIATLSMVSLSPADQMNASRRIRRHPTMSTLLTTDSVAAFVSASLDRSSNPPVNPSEPLVVTEISDGNLNFAWCVAEACDNSRAVFVKQAPNYIKCLGEGFALGAERMVVESEVRTGASFLLSASCCSPRLVIDSTPLRRCWRSTRQRCQTTCRSSSYATMPGAP